MGKTKWIQKANLKKGALRKTLGTKKGKKIPVKTLKKAAAGKGVSKLTEKRAKTAMTLKKIRKKKK